jgi:hypothetical protein
MSGALSAGVESPAVEAYHLLSTRVEITNAWSYTSILPYA